MYVNLIYVVLIVALAILYIIGCGLAKCGNDRIAIYKMATDPRPVAGRGPVF